MPRPVNPYRYYIIDLSDINKVRYYNTPYYSKKEAKEAIDTYIPRGVEVDIISGAELLLRRHIKRSKKRIPAHSPAVLRDPKAKAVVNLYKKRRRLKNKGIKTHLFKDPYKPKGDIKEDRDRIRNQILK